MQQKQIPALILVFALLLCGCVGRQNAPPSASPMPTHEAAPAATPAPTTPATASPVQPENSAEPTSPPHSPLYLPSCTAEQITEYFNEVVHHVEYSDGTGDDHLVQKWLSPIRYRICGTPTEADEAALRAIVQQLNAVPGFPGICPAEDGMQENMTISFLDPAAFSDSFSSVINGEYAFGATQFWYYTQTNELHTARIGCRTDIAQISRDSVLPEEIINSLGISDTITRTDSITYQYSDENTQLSDIDLLILTLLYNPAIRCGMDADSTAAVIRELYY